MEENIIHCATLMDLKHLKILELRKTCIKNSKTVLYYVPTFWRRTQTLILCSPSGDLPRRTWQSSTCLTIFCNFQKAQDKQTTQYRRKNVEWWCPFVMILLPRSRYSKIIGWSQRSGDIGGKKCVRTPIDRIAIYMIWKWMQQVFEWKCFDTQWKRRPFSLCTWTIWWWELAEKSSETYVFLCETLCSKRNHICVEYNGMCVAGMQKEHEDLYLWYPQ